MDVNIDLIGITSLETHVEDNWLMVCLSDHLPLCKCNHQPYPTLNHNWLIGQLSKINLKRFDAN